MKSAAVQATRGKYLATLEHDKVLRVLLQGFLQLGLEPLREALEVLVAQQLRTRRPIARLVGQAPLQDMHQRQ